jgi:hypothetical protein
MIHGGYYGIIKAGTASLQHGGGLIKGPFLGLQKVAAADSFGRLHRG